jgi:opacity protein-like surface antigen
MKLSKVILGMAVIAAPLTAQAQSNDSTKAIGVGLIGGATFPVGNYSDVAATGFHFGGFIDFGRRIGPAGLRADVVYHGFGDKDLVTTGPGATEVTFSNKFSLVSGTLNLVFGVPMENSPIRPYVLGGIGGYYVKNSPKCVGCSPLLNFEDESTTKFGLNGGGGIEFGLGNANVFLEARYHHILSAAPQIDCLGETDCNRAAAKLVPVSLGVKMRF